MGQETFYTIKEATELYGIPNLTQLWMSGKFPNAILGSDKTVRIPKADLDSMFPTFKPHEPPPDFTQLKQEAEDYAAKVRSDADSYASAIRQEADLQFAETTKQIDTEIQKKRNTLILLTFKVDELTMQVEELQKSKTLCIEKYNEILATARHNKSYHYHMAQRDRWGSFLDWLETQFRVK